jgi:tRNA nucleotidyltransferase (CCA-adding enzyme)
VPDRTSRVGDPTSSPSEPASGSLDADATVAAAASQMASANLDHLTLLGGTAGAVVGRVTRREVDGAMRHGLGALAAVLVSAGGTKVEVAPVEAPTPSDMRGRLRQALGGSWGHVEALGVLASEKGMGLELVGGAVRDLLLGKPVADVDLVVDGDAGALARAAADRLGGSCVLHAAFNTAKWQPPGAATAIDLAAARTEVYPSRAALPVVSRADLDADLFRRDFSINAMAAAVDPVHLGVLRDPFGGLSDLRAGLVRVLHGLSFHDDPTRAFRAARFAARLDFRLAEGTATLLGVAIRTGAFALLGVERLGAEFTRLLREPTAAQGLGRVGAWGLAPAVHRALVVDEQLRDRVAAVQRSAHEIRALQSPTAGGVPVEFDIAEALWMLVADRIPAPERAVLDRMVPGGRVAQRRARVGLRDVEAAARALRDEEDAGRAGRLLVEMDAVERCVLLGTDEAGAGEWVRWWAREGSVIRSPVNGHDLLVAGVPAGPAVGRALAAAQEAAWNGRSPPEQRAAALAAARA